MRPLLAAMILFIPATGHAQSVPDDACWRTNLDGLDVFLDPVCANRSKVQGASALPHCETGYWLLALPHTSALVCAKDLKDPTP